MRTNTHLTRLWQVPEVSLYKVTGIWQAINSPVLNLERGSVIVNKVRHQIYHRRPEAKISKAMFSHKETHKLEQKQTAR